MEVKIIYSSHLELRLKLRSIPRALPMRIYESSKNRYFDRETGLYIDVGRAAHRGKRREFVVVYKETESGMLLVTIHPLKTRQREVRVKSGRWQRI